jgi:hypothetical protein
MRTDLLALAAHLLIRCLAVGGCTIVQIDGPARISTPRFGILRIEPARDADTVIYHVRGIGLVPGRGGATLGASSETAALIYGRDTCRIILFEPNERHVAALADILGPARAPIGDVCLAGEKK